MLQLNLIRQNPAFVKERLAVKHFSPLTLVDDLLLLDERRRKQQFDNDEIQAKINTASKEIGNLMRDGKKAEAEQLKAEVTTLKSTMADPAALQEIEQAIQQILYQLPNLPAEQVPVGRKPEDNVLVRSGGEKPVFTGVAKPHWELVQQYDLIDFELGNKITGSGFPVYKNKGAKFSIFSISIRLQVIWKFNHRCW
jgi:seryl-tRNA synthetase